MHAGTMYCAHVEASTWSPCPRNKSQKEARHAQHGLELGYWPASTWQRAHGNKQLKSDTGNPQKRARQHHNTTKSRRDHIPVPFADSDGPISWSSAHWFSSA
ncbi:hypothetical protein MN608_00122 [Microdochium nivale]|nr:hypothetical protein MN608_00122 [Microdochium nivale]